MNTLSFILAAVFLLALAAPCRGRQGRGTREPFPTAGPARGPRAGSKGVPASGAGRSAGRERKPKPAPAASAFSISVTPSDSTIKWQGANYQAESGLFLRDGLRPGEYTVAVRREGYRDKDIEIHLEPGDHKLLSVSLDRLSGFISVWPLVAGAEINIVEAATGRSVGIYSGRVSNVELTPGHYQVFVSKEGYKTTLREVSVAPAVNTPIEPALERLPDRNPPARRPAAPPFSRDYSTRAQVSPEGKFIVVALSGRSGDTSDALGAIDVTLSVAGGQAQVTSLSGMLTGYPCQVDFVRLENVAEYSFVEPPGAANQWARAVVRLRPKESKRPVHFLINWKSLRSLAPDGSPAN